MPLKAYLVEDAPTVAAVLAEVLLTLAQTEVVGTSNGAVEASSWLLQNSHRWDLAIVDLRLASGSGLSVLAACRVRSADQRAVVVSNQSDSSMQMRCKVFGADAFFDKSTQLDELVHYCARLSDGAALNRHAPSAGPSAARGASPGAPDLRGPGPARAPRQRR